MSMILIALIGGILPALFWLYFWLKEDKLNPEPKKLIILTFIFGMLAVLIAFHAEKTTESLIPAEQTYLLFIVWAFIEEFAKYGAAFIVGLRSKFFDEPIDALIYMITAALGFAALENSLFIASELMDGNILDGIVVGNLRFIGASLLHVLASGIIGIFIALAFYKSRRIKFLSLIAGIVVATAVHALFNVKLTAGTEGSGYAIFSVFTAVWLAIILLLMAFEKVKRLRTVNQKLS